MPSAKLPDSSDDISLLDFEAQRPASLDRVRVPLLHNNLLLRKPSDEFLPKNDGCTQGRGEFICRRRCCLSDECVWVFHLASFFPGPVYNARCDRSRRSLLKWLGGIVIRKCGTRQRGVDLFHVKHFGNRAKSGEVPRGTNLRKSQNGRRIKPNLAPKHLLFLPEITKVFHRSAGFWLV